MRFSVRKFLIPVLIALVGVLSLTSRLMTPDAHAAGPVPLYYSGTLNVASLVDAAGESDTATIYNAVLGDFCIASMGVSTAGITVTCNVTAADTVTVRFQNESGGTVDLASTTLRVIVFQHPSVGVGS